MIYLDTSAAAKLIRVEPESVALTTFLAERIALPLVSSALLYPELVRAAARHEPDHVGRAIALTQRVMTVPLASDIVTSAATIGGPLIRTLDALHLATAKVIAESLHAFVTYDKRQADAAASEGLPVATPA
ncbi:type II toxin-antitoxin system VapC family toxin [Phytohabitans flavus]|uniref:Ribonuclease VapC n=1 Tax=Phytohabitans flavus TaxID=1076124 RepID=A0A6F8Y2B1_9ACTN|nr:type II toxin-antitoxin system VapC family toxin [Phytohabitans flavus]BCB80246.1 ribonuclease VapC [Phytohabitans flavus]